ncbi:ribosome biogenesis protein [Candidatus Pacearchaeota archaeon]|nr:ribosome biogenesis protein [Candidatus Pacearchaeota archaeon]
MKLRKCPSCNNYTLKENCSKCKLKTEEAHYKFRERFIKKQSTNIQ